ncbi:hypothetical protein V9T40_001936 [Parthenolecanium corni]|uniref:Dipeptidase n=1 Tax=Parthenolecanium corni TaxID=536013 RepID=A0AAN9TFA7_9HEMI
MQDKTKTYSRAFNKDRETIMNQKHENTKLNKMTEMTFKLLANYYQELFPVTFLLASEQTNCLPGKASEQLPGIFRPVLAQDYQSWTTSGLEDVSHFPELLNTLIVKHNWTETQMKKLVGLNVLRVLQQVEKIRDELKDIMHPDEDTILAHYYYKNLPNDCAVHNL